MEIDGLCQATTMSEKLVSLTTYLCRPLLSVLDVKSVWADVLENVIFFTVLNLLCLPKSSMVQFHESFFSFLTKILHNAAQVDYIRS